MDAWLSIGGSAFAEMPARGALERLVPCVCYYWPHGVNPIYRIGTVIVFGGGHLGDALGDSRFRLSVLRYPFQYDHQPTLFDMHLDCRVTREIAGPYRLRAAVTIEPLANPHAPNGPGVRVAIRAHRTDPVYLRLLESLPGRAPREYPLGGFWHSVAL